MKKVCVLAFASLLSLAAWAQSAASAAKPGTTQFTPYKSAKPKPAEPATAPMGPEELAIAELVHVGRLPCELGASVRLDADATHPGYFHVQGKGFRYRMHPVATTTGAIRLEDKKAGVVWLQLANKSMLMDQGKGRRVADECVNPDQMAFAADMKTNPPPVLFDTTGMGRTND